MSEENRASKDALKVRALTQRISTLVANYEEQLAELRADATLTMDSLNAQVQALMAELEAERVKNVPQEDQAEESADEPVTE